MGLAGGGAVDRLDSAVSQGLKCTRLNLADGTWYVPATLRPRHRRSGGTDASPGNSSSGRLNVTRTLMTNALKITDSEASNPVWRTRKSFELFRFDHVASQFKRVDLCNPVCNLLASRRGSRISKQVL